MACTQACNQGRRCACAVFHDPDFDADADDFRAESAAALFWQSIAAFFALVTAGLAIVAALDN